MMIYNSGIDAGIKLRPTDEELGKIGPAFAKKWEAFFANALDKPALWLGPMARWASSNILTRNVHANKLTVDSSEITLLPHIVNSLTFCLLRAIPQQGGMCISPLPMMSFPR